MLPVLSQDGTKYDRPSLKGGGTMNEIFTDIFIRAWFSGSGASTGCARNRRILGRPIDSHATAKSP
jgi:hypothetical protein